jgi:hypothetical protein
MPARPFYFHRLSDAIEELKRWDAAWIDRRMLQELLGLSKAVAWRLMRRCGAEEGPGHALMCRREGLIEALEELRATGECRREAGRRDRVEAYLRQMAEFARSRKTPVAAEGKASELMASRFGKLPAGVALTPRRLTLEFAGPEDFLQKIGSVIFALQNDFEAIREFIESGPPEGNR